MTPTQEGYWLGAGLVAVGFCIGVLTCIGILAALA